MAIPVTPTSPKFPEITNALIPAEKINEPIITKMISLIVLFTQSPLKLCLIIKMLA